MKLYDRPLRMVLFDLDGTLLPMDNDEFTKGYFKLLAAKMISYGYEPQELTDAVWYGTAGMVKNDGSRTNEEAFWDRFAERYGEKGRSDKPIFDAFYENEFDGTIAFCGKDENARSVVDHLKDNRIRVALATNPLFPEVATMKRVRWAGFAPEEFELITTYENSCYCKPNPDYYRDVLKRLACEPEECLMVGNDVTEDMDAAAEAGIQGFLITDHMINRQEKALSDYRHGSFIDLSDFMKRRGMTS